MGKLKWLLPVLIAIVALTLYWWVFRERTYTARDLMSRDNSAIMFILADMDEKRLVELRQELQKMRGQPGNPDEKAEVDRVYALTTNAMRTRGIDERRHNK